MDCKDVFIIAVLDQFNRFLIKEYGFRLISINYNPIVDDPYSLTYKTNRLKDVELSFYLDMYFEESSDFNPISIVFSFPKSKLYSLLGMQYFGYGKDSRNYISLEEILIKKEKSNFLKTQINKRNVVAILEKSKSYIKQNLIPFLQGDIELIESFMKSRH